MANGVKTVLLLGALSGLLLVIGDLMGGANGLMIAFLLAAVMNMASYWFSDKIVLRMYHAQEVAPGHPLHNLVARLAQRASLPMPKVYIIPDASPNAFATGRNPSHAAVAATQGIMQALSEHELEGVIAHELAHVKNRDILISSVAATIAATIMMVARMAQFAAFFGRDLHYDVIRANDLSPFLYECRQYARALWASAADFALAHRQSRADQQAKQDDARDQTGLSER